MISWAWLIQRPEFCGTTHKVAITPLGDSKKLQASNGNQRGKGVSFD
jgi:hypothetical protein